MQFFVLFVYLLLVGNCKMLFLLACNSHVCIEFFSSSFEYVCFDDDEQKENAQNYGA